MNLYTTDGRQLQVSGNTIYIHSGKAVGRIKGKRVYRIDGRYVGTIVGDRLVFQSAHSAELIFPSSEANRGVSHLKR